MRDSGARTALSVASTSQLSRPRPKLRAGLVWGHACDVHYLEKYTAPTLFHASPLWTSRSALKIRIRIRIR